MFPLKSYAETPRKYLLVSPYFLSLFAKKLRGEQKHRIPRLRLFASSMSERIFGFERAYGISLKRTMSSPYPKPRKRPTKNRKGIFPSLPKRTGSFIYLWTFSAIIFDSISFFSSSNPFYANSNSVFLLNLS